MESRLIEKVEFELSRPVHLICVALLGLGMVGCGKQGGQSPNAGTPPAGSNQPQAAPEKPQRLDTSLGGGSSGGGSVTGSEPGASQTGVESEVAQQIGDVAIDYTRCEEDSNGERNCMAVSVDHNGRRTETPIAGGQASLSAHLRQSALSGSEQYGVGETAVFAQTLGQTIEQVYTVRRLQSQANSQLATFLESDVRSSQRPDVPLFYSGAAADELRSHVANKWSAEQAGAPEALQQSMVVFAKSIDDVRLNFESERGQLPQTVRLSAQYKGESGQTLSLELSGRRVLQDTKAESEPSPLRFSLPATNDSGQISATVFCVDMTPGCANAVVRFQQTRSTSSSANRSDDPAATRNAYVIVRTSPVDLFFEGSQSPDGQSSFGYRTFLNGLSNASSRSRAFPRIDRVAVTSSETIGGSAQMRTLVVLQSLDASNQIREEALEFSGPLVKPRDTERVLLSYNGPRRAKEVETNSIDERREQGVSSLVLHTIKGVALIRNNGFGSYGLVLEFPRNAQANQQQTVDTLHLHLRRANLNVMTPNQFQ